MLCEGSSQWKRGLFNRNMGRVWMKDDSQEHCFWAWRGAWGINVSLLLQPGSWWGFVLSEAFLFYLWNSSLQWVKIGQRWIENGLREPTGKLLYELQVALTLVFFSQAGFIFSFEKKRVGRKWKNSIPKHMIHFSSSTHMLPSCLAHPW